MILLFLPLLLATCVQSCKEVTTDCAFDETKFTIDQVIADINESLKESTDFFVKFETNLHTFAVEMESRLRADKFMLERLLKLQQKHGSQFPKTSAFKTICEEHFEKKCTSDVGSIDDDWKETNVIATAKTLNGSEPSCPAMSGRSSAALQFHYKTEKGEMVAGNQLKCSNGTWTDALKNDDSEKVVANNVVCAIDKNEVCKSLVKNAKRCNNCTHPTYDHVNMIYTCTKDYAFDLSQETRQVSCEFTDTKVELVYEGNGTSAVYNGELTCIKLPADIKKRNPCPYTCAESAECRENKLVCACLKGYVDVSSQFEKPAGSICTKCNNSEQGTDFVMLYDQSSSVGNHSIKMVNFVANFLKFIDLDNSENRFSLIEFSSWGELRFPLWPKTSTQDIIDTLTNNASSYTGGATNTPIALKIANDMVYAQLPTDSTRSKVTILFTDGAPTLCYSFFENLSENIKIYEDASTNLLANYYLRRMAAEGRTEQYTKEEMWAPYIEDLQRESRKMKETYNAKILTVYIGRDTDESSVRLMREITSEDEELSVDNFDDLENDLLDRLQMKIC